MLSTYANPLYSTSDLCQIQYNTYPTHYPEVLRLIYGFMAAALGPLAAPLCPEILITQPNPQIIQK